MGADISIAAQQYLYHSNVFYMKINFSTPIIVGILSCLIIGPVSAMEGLNPLSPKELLEALPRVKEDWRLIKSEGKTDIDEWLLSKAERIYERPAEKEGEPDILCKIVITDTAKRGAAIEVFEGFTPENFDGLKKWMRNGNPAILRTTTKQINFSSLVDGRFLINIYLRNGEQKDIGEFLEDLDTKLLVGKGGKSSQIEYDGLMVVRVIDEINPKRNKIYEVVHSLVELAPEVEKQLLARQAAYESEMAGREITVEEMLGGEEEVTKQPDGE